MRIDSSSESEIRTSVLIVNYNGRNLLESCLASLAQQDVRDFEVIVVDNGSVDGSAAWLSTCQYPWLRAIQLQRNEGFGAGNNAGLAVSRGEFVVLLNNDTTVPPDFIRRITAPFNDPSVSMVAPLILYHHDRTRIDKAGGHYFYPDGLNRGRGCGTLLTPRWEKPGECFYPDGCAAAFRRSLIQQAGFFDEDFYLYGEDTDLGIRYRRAGARCVYAPDARVYHVHSATAGKYGAQKAYFVERNRIFVMIKNLPWFWIVLSPVFTGIRYFMQAAAALSGKGSPGRFSGSKRELLWILYKANRDGWRALPTLLHKRKALRPLFKVGDLPFSRLMMRYFLAPWEIAFRD